MADQQRAVSSAATGKLPDGFTPLHVAVLKDDRKQVRALLRSREYGVNARSSTGATPLMIASMYGRTAIFHYLVRKRALLEKADNQGFTALNYAKGAFTRDLILRYQDIATGNPHRSGQLTIYHLLKAFERTSNNARLPRLPGPPSDAPKSDTSTSDASTSGTSLPRTIFIRSENGKHLELVQVRRLAAADVDINLGRKSTGIIRVNNEVNTKHKFAISGWSGVKGRDVLCNKELSSLVRRVCRLYGFKLEASCFDVRWRGDPADKKGCHKSVHVEKQLGVWVLVDSLSQALETEDITKENVAKLKELSPQLPARLIELDHEPCSSCLNFLRLLKQKAGLTIDWKSRQWFVHGQRSKLRRRDGRPATDNSDNEDITEDEVDEESIPEDKVDGLEEEDGSDYSLATMAQEDDTAAVDTDPQGGASDSSPHLSTVQQINHRVQLQSQLRRQPSSPYPKGRSPIHEPPPDDLPRWPEFNMTPRPRFQKMLPNLSSWS